MKLLPSSNQRLMILFTLSANLLTHAMELSDIGDVTKMREKQQHLSLSSDNGSEKDCMPSHTQMQNEAYKPHDLKKAQKKAALLARNVRTYLCKPNDIVKFKNETAPVIHYLINDTQIIQQQYSLNPDMQKSLEGLKKTLNKATHSGFWKNITKKDNKNLKGLRDTLETVPTLYKALSSCPQKTNAPILTTLTKSSSASSHDDDDDEDCGSINSKTNTCNNATDPLNLENIPVSTTNTASELMHTAVSEVPHNEAMPATTTIHENNIFLEQKLVPLPPAEVEALFQDFQQIKLLRERLKENFRRELSSFQKSIDDGDRILSKYTINFKNASTSIDRLQSNLEELYAPLKNATAQETLFAPDAVEIQRYKQLKKWVDNDFKEIIDEVRIQRTHNFITNIRHKRLLSNDEKLPTFKIISVENNIKSIQEQACTWGLTDQDNSTLASIVVQIEKTMGSLSNNDCRKNEWPITIHTLKELAQWRDKRINKENGVKEKISNDILDIRQTINKKLSILENNKSSDELKEQAMKYIHNHTFIFMPGAKKDLPDHVQQQLNATERAWDAFQRDWDYSQKPWYLRAISWLFGWSPEKIKQPKPQMNDTTKKSWLPSWFNK